MSGTDVYYFLEHGKRLERPSRCPSSTYHLMLKCWEWDEKKRPTFSDLLQLLNLDHDYRDNNKTNSLTNTLSRKKSLKNTLSSSTLTDEYSREKNDDHSSEQKLEQYKNNGNGHVSKKINIFQQTIDKERTNS